MTTTETLTGRALDARVAEVVMGLRLGSPRVFDEPHYYDSAEQWYISVPVYSTDPAAARLVEDEIARRGLEDDYVTALRQIVGSRWPESAFLWYLIRATPEARCRAALIACGEGGHDELHRRCA